MDASSSALSAVLQQHVEGAWLPLAFFSQRLNDVQTHYCLCSRGLLAIWAAIRYFRYFLKGHIFHVLNNHKPLAYVFLSNCSDYLSWETCQLIYISVYH